MRLAVSGHEAYVYTGTRPIVPGRPAVLFVHGAGNDHSVWALQSRYFAHHGFNVLTPDLPGHGRSGGKPLAEVQAIADWLAALLEAARVERATIVGHSLGALAVLEMASRHHARVVRIALLGPGVPMPVSEALLAAARADDPGACDMIVGWSHAPARQIGGNPAPGMWMTGNALRLLQRSRPGVLYVDLMACHTYVQGLDAAASVRCPSLVVLGSRDLMAPPKSAAALIERLADPRVVTLADGGHAMMAEQPDAVLDALRGFVAD